MRKWKIVGMALVLFLVIWGGAAQAQEKITIRIMDYFVPTDTLAPHFEEVFRKFEADFPNVRIQHEGLESADFRTKLAVEMAAGNPPDISYVVVGLSWEYGEQGLLMDLAPVFEKEKEWRETIVSTAIKAFSTSDGKIYAVPFVAQIGGLYYNKNVYERAGISGPPSTWDELMEQVEKVKKVGAYAFVTGGKEWRYAWFITQLLVRTAGVDKYFQLARGSEVTGWNKPENGFIDALRLFKELVDAGAFPEGLNGIPRDIARMMFVQNQVAMYYEGSWKVNVWKNLGGEDFLNNAVGWSLFPTVPKAKGDQDGMVGGPVHGWGISAKLDETKKPLVIELVKRITSPEMASHFLDNAQPVVVKVDASVMARVHPILQKQFEEYNKAAKVALPTDVICVPPVDNAIKKVAVPGIVDGSLTPEEAAEEVNREAEKYFSGKK